MTTHRKEHRELLSGDEAVARGAWECGVQVACSYPGTPATEILETLARWPEVDAQWSVNEKVAYEVALGAALGGVRSLYASKHVGLNVAMDPLMTSSYTGVNAGFVAVTCDDPGLHSSQNEQDNRWIALFAKLPMVEPASPAEVRAHVRSAFELSEQFDTPVLLRMTTRVAHSKEDVAVGPRVAVPARPFERNAAKLVMVPRNAYARHVLVEQRLERLRAYAETSPLNRVEPGRADLGFVVGGVAYLYAKEQYPDASFLKLGFTYPFADETILRFAAQVKELVVLEELDPFIEEHLRALGVRFKAKHPSFRVGELRPEHIVPIVAGQARPDAPAPAAARRPVLCPGCGHRYVFTVLKKLKLTVSGDIGCYTLAAGGPLAALHSCICMGAGITLHEGLRRALPDLPLVGVIGDSTFLHSGVPGLLNAVFNKVRGVLLILDNGTTAMTGGQDHPATGRTLRGEETRRVALEDLCRSCGVDHVDVIDPAHHKAFLALLQQRLGEPGLTVIVERHPCRELLRVKNPSPKILKDLCKQCYACLGIDCPALRKGADEFVEPDAHLCAGCNLCVDQCKFAALVRREPTDN